MLEQGRITQAEYADGIEQTLPDEHRAAVGGHEGAVLHDLGQPAARRPLRRAQGVRGRAAASRPRSTSQLQEAAQKAIANNLGSLGPNGPTASLVAIDNKTGEVRAMVGGGDYRTHPFNLATQGQRQPGSTFKPFILAAGAEEGLSAWARSGTSRKRVFDVPNTAARRSSSSTTSTTPTPARATWASALTFSDNSVFAAVGIATGTKRIAKLARAHGHPHAGLDNPAMTLGGLQAGRHARSTWRTPTRRSPAAATAIWRLARAPPDDGPVGIERGAPRSAGARCSRRNQRRSHTRVLLAQPRRS